MKKIFIVIFLLSIFLLFGCVSTKARDQAKKKCINLCLMERQANRNLSLGPCLSNKIAPDWVCDVAHYPREKIDNNPNYQCQAYRNGTAHHFVEVTPNCKFIRAI